MLRVLGWILLGAGYLFTIGLLRVPYFRLKELWIAEQGVDHLPVMYLLSLFNSLTWVCYGWLPPHKYAVLIICVVGAVVQLVYTIWYIINCARPGGKLFTAFFLAVVLLTWGGLAFMIFLSDGGLFGGGPNSLDSLATFTSALTYLGPLADTLVALYTGDHARMSVPVILVSLGNAVFWGEYGRVTGQRIIRIANEVGLGRPILQLVVYLGLRHNELHQIIYEEIPEFYAQMKRHAR
ncbi:hypothetical protein ACQ4PT_003443 [Festuca glaucescens]